MKQKIEAQIENINNSLEWIKNNKPADYERRFLQLVEERRKLSILANAESNNPGVAAFGQSQVGKSYLMNCILQNSNSSFLVEAENKMYDFVDEINPIGEGAEATGVITRFSSYKRNSALYNKKYPIRMKVLSIADMICVIADTYFNEFDDYTTLGENEVTTLLEEWVNKYSAMPEQSNVHIFPDDLLNIKCYFKKHINNAQVYSTKTSFFDTLALMINRIPQSDYAEIFSRLWNNEEAYNKLFNHSLEILRRLNFLDYIYLPITAVLHGGTKEDTIMSVSCLKLLTMDAEVRYKTNAYSLREETAISLGEFTKSELCTVCSEVVIKINQEYLTTMGQYDKSGMHDYARSVLSDDMIKMEVLANTDLLDFPGARARGNMRLMQVQGNNSKSHENLMYSLLRGKIAYLFNKYNEEKIINILLLCHHHKNVEAPQMWQLIDEWVKEYVGDTPEKRNEYIQKVGVSPLFHIGTMYNLNLQEPDNGINGKTDNAIKSRWIGRFKEKLIGECFKNADWVTNWIGKDKPFQNCFMLRDFKFSKTVYNGWSDSKKETSLVIEEEYFERMRKLFLECNEEYRLFENAELTWDVSSTRNNDGALYILEKLSKASNNIGEARESLIKNMYSSCCKNVYSIMKEYYVSTNADELLNGNIRKAKAIFREMDFTCNNDNYYFGHLIQALQITESDSYRAIHKIIQSPEINGMVNDFKDYEIIRNSCEKAGHSIENCTTESEKMNCVIETYGFLSPEEAEDYFRKKGIDKQKLFSGLYKRKLNSCIIADSVYTKWCTAIKSVDFFNEFSQEDGFDATIMNNLVDELILTAEALGVRDIMAASIAEYVDIIDVHAANESLIADMLADTINDFVNDFGFSLLSEEDKLKAKGLCEKRNLPAFKYIEKELPAEMDEVALTNLFNEMSANPKALLPSFEDNYNKWLEYMFISFVAHLDIPDFDHEANVALESLLEKIKVA